jgi:flagellar M-ring protein FliF
MTSPGAQLDRRPTTGNSAQIVSGASALWTRARVQWASMTAPQRRGSIVAALLLGGLLGTILWYGLRTDWRTLYAGLEPEDARQTGQILTQAQISFDVTDNGTAIRVPAPQLDKARLATAARGAMKSGRMGFELFDKPNWVGSEFDERVNYQRALEGELEHTVGSLADVESARVHLVLAHDSLFREEERPAKASVVLRPRRGSLADGEAESIRNLVSSAVDGLAPDRVVLVDAAGHLPLGPKTTAAMQLSEEQALEEKLISTLEPITGPGNVRASVTLDYDSAAAEETRESYDPTQTVTLSMQRTEQSTGPESVAAGVPGTASNAPNSQALPVYPRQMTPPQTAKTESGTYGVSKTVRHVIEHPGKVRRLTAAIVVNDRLIRPAAKGTQAQWQPRSADELRNLTALSQAAVGFDATRGDALTVQDLSFDENRVQAPKSIPVEMLSTVENSPVLVKYLTLFVCLLVILAFGVRPALRAAAPEINALRNKDAQHELPVQASPQPSLSAPEMAEPDPERKRAQEILEQVSSQLKREPAQSSRLLQSWIHSE